MLRSGSFILKLITTFFGQCGSPTLPATKAGIVRKEIATTAPSSCVLPKPARSLPFLTVKGWTQPHLCIVPKLAAAAPRPNPHVPKSKAAEMCAPLCLNVGLSLIPFGGGVIFIIFNSV